MASNYEQYDNRNNASTEEDDVSPQSPNSKIESVTRLISQRQLSDGRSLTHYFMIFENGQNTDSCEVRFLEYLGTRGRHHHKYQLHLPQVTSQIETASIEMNEEFSKCVKEVLRSISYEDLESYDVTVRTGVSYFFSKRFRFDRSYSIEEIRELIQKNIPTSNIRYYYQPKYNTSQTDDSLRSSFCNIKPINQVSEFVKKLEEFNFFVKQQKHIFRVYLQADDNQTHICTIDPAQSFSIVEFSKDFQRTSNIDFIRDRRSSKFTRSKTYDDVFDFRVQFQYNPCTGRDQMANITYELRQQFPSVDSNFKNLNILQTINNNSNDDAEIQICEELSPYVKYIRRDFGDVYKHMGDDALFENFSIYLESSAEYDKNRDTGTWKRKLDTHGIVYARLNLNTMLSLNSIDEDSLASKLWNMGEGLTWMAGQFTTNETQKSTIYHVSNGNQYTAQDEALVQGILKQNNLCLMLSLPLYATKKDITDAYNSLQKQMDTKWNCIKSGRHACEKLDEFYRDYFSRSS